MIDQISAMFHAIGVGYVGAGCYIALVIIVFMFLGARRGK